MTGETLMVLKRIFAMALGALGLGALAAGSAFAQSPQPAGNGNIPAPNIFDDQINCSMFVPAGMDTPMPTMVPDGGMTSPLDDIIGMGDRTLDATGLTGVTVGTQTGVQVVADLGYVIPPGNSNCGAGATGPTFGAMNNDVDDDGIFEAGDTFAAGAIAIDVANGYTALLDLYKAVYGDPGTTTGGTQRTLDAAEKALADELAKTSPNQTLVTQLTTDRDDAQTAHNKALTAFNAASQGPIYQAGVAEWMAKAAVTQSIADYNAASRR